MYVCMYFYVHMHLYMYVCIYAYMCVYRHSQMDRHKIERMRQTDKKDKWIYRIRTRETEADRETERQGNGCRHKETGT